MKLTNYASGHAAENTAAGYLQQIGFDVIGQNWRTRLCEIDIVATKESVVYFVEVKSRRSTEQGHGYEYVTPKKLQQMSFAAELWVRAHNWLGDYQLAVISIDAGEITFIDDLM